MSTERNAMRLLIKWADGRPAVASDRATWDDAYLESLYALFIGGATAVEGVGNE